MEHLRMGWLQNRNHTKNRSKNPNLVNFVTLYKKNNWIKEQASSTPHENEVAIDNTTATTDATAATQADASGYIPEPPAIPVENLELTSLGEPTLHSLGLGSWTPAGMVQQVLELFHVSLDLPWYGSIILYTIILRTCLLPLTIKLQRSSANMRVFAPQMQELNQKMMDARTKGNQLESNFELKLI